MTEGPTVSAAADPDQPRLDIETNDGTSFATQVIPAELTRSVLAPRTGIMVSASKVLRDGGVVPSPGGMHMISAQFSIHWPLSVSDDDLEEVLQAVVIKAQDRLENLRATQRQRQQQRPQSRRK